MRKDDVIYNYNFHGRFTITNILRFEGETKETGAATRLGGFDLNYYTDLPRWIYIWRIKLNTE